MTVFCKIAISVPHFTLVSCFYNSTNSLEEIYFGQSSHLVGRQKLVTSSPVSGVHPKLQAKLQLPS
jgi:hypothetical protein